MKLSINNEEKQTRVIEVTENKILKLNNVLKKSLTEKQMYNLPKTLEVIQGFIKARNLETIGPLITNTKVVVEGGIPKTIVDVLVQLKEEPSVKFEYPYRFVPQIRVENCLYTRFVGQQEDLQLAYLKLKVYAYERYISITNSSYAVFLKPNNGEFMCDAFVEVQSE